ncbi:TraM recognition domain-containing protein [Idiomarina abyssalis]|uniref:TraD/TraG TraM recognition site domain-containing protein n=2 Tax=Idiomarina abyssalis TaxID=86102 RepID=A0A8I1GDI8_9GAMM|nr:hypothetical protein [Idiomarina abyssalis]MBJ7265559.1 hypothetical protein [Idiomarina abyssalis]MBJ7316767.1 hypothetical protein [Idiomarina abyssalis]
MAMHESMSYSNLVAISQARESNFTDIAHRSPLSFLKSKTAAIIAAALGVTALAFPVTLPISGALLAGTCALSYRKQKKESTQYPLYAPMHSKAKVDPLDLDPGTKKPVPPRGIIYYGVEEGTFRQLWGTAESEVRHHFLQGSTGSGKSVVIFATRIFGYLLMGSGALLGDGKSDLTTPATVAAICHRTMRLHDFYVLNYITGGRDVWGLTTSELSSTINPFLTGSYSTCTELVKKLLNDDGDIWTKRAMAFVDALTRPLVYLRDIGEIQFNVGHYSDYLTLDALGKLAGRQDIPFRYRRELYNFIKTLPGLDANSFNALLKGEPFNPKKSTQPLDQLGFCVMQISPVINLLAGDYGHIFGVLHGSISVRDIVMKRRVCVFLLPSLEKASASVRSLGQIVLALVNDLLASGIGNQQEGDLQQALDSRWTNDRYPFSLTLDEVSFYFQRDLVNLIYAQARSLKLSAGIGNQDNYAIEKLGDAEAKDLKTIFANSNIKMIGKLTDGADSVEQILDLLPERVVYETKSMQRTVGLVSSSYGAQEVSAERRKLLDATDFQRLREGQFFIIHSDRVIRANMLGVFPKILLNQKINSLVPPNELPEERAKNLVTYFNNTYRKIVLHQRRLDEAGGKTNQAVTTKEVSRLIGYINEEDKPTLTGVFDALQRVEDDLSSALKERLAALTQSSSKLKTSDEVIKSNEVSEPTKERPSQSGDTDSALPASEQSSTEKPVDPNSNMQLNLGASGSSADDSVSERVNQQIDHLLGDINETISQMGEINIREAFNRGEQMTVETATEQARETIKKVDEALTSHPTPPIPTIDPEQYLNTLKNIQAMLSPNFDDEN